MTKTTVVIIVYTTSVNLCNIIYIMNMLYNVYIAWVETINVKTWFVNIKSLVL